jgi:hypothetical protein
MRSAHITRRQAEAAFGELDADVSALQQEVATALELSFEIDRVVEVVDLELTAEEQAAMVRFLHDFTDTRRAHRTRRRASREMLRALPGRIVPSAAAEGEAA